MRGGVIFALAITAAMVTGGIVRSGETAEVTTIAGSGMAGIADGPAQKATFLFPYGVAVAPDGSIYISDRAAQRIRVLTTSGQVRTVAGSGPIEPPGLIVQPGYHDGPALEARFAGPEGLAVGPDGALYIADSYNHCIRKLWQGYVTTDAGKCDHPGSTDGTRDAALLTHPKNLAFDAAGNLYIADDGVGLRKLSTDGLLTTIHFKSYDGQSALGVAVVNQPELMVVVSGLDGVVTYYPATGKDEHFHKYALEWPSSVPQQLAEVDSRQFVFVDPQANNVRYLRLPAPPLADGAFTRIIGGGDAERASENAGYVDGSGSDARFYDPMGVVIVGNKAIIADGGNRRVRQVILPNMRVPGWGMNAREMTRADRYEIALLGGPWTFSDSLGDDSICAHIEATLNRSHRFSKPARCHTIAIDPGPESIEDYVKKIVTMHHVDLVIIGAGSSQYGGRGSENIRAQMQGLLDALKPLRTQLALVWVYPPRDISFADADWILNGRSYPSPEEHVVTVKLQSALRGMPILQYDAYADLVKYELSTGARPLYNPPDDGGPNPRGNAFLGDHFAQGLLDAGLGTLGTSMLLPPWPPADLGWKSH